MNNRIIIEKKEKGYVVFMGEMEFTFPSWQNTLLFLSSEQFINKDKYPPIEDVRKILIE